MIYLIKFRDKYSDTKDFISEPGKPTLEEYEYDVDKDGVQQLVKTDRVTDVHAKIQADYPSTDINLLMKKFALGDTSAIDIKQGFYGDVTKMPTNYAELFDRAVECQQFFDSLPADLKQMFDNSYTEFFSEMDNDVKGFNDKIAEYNDRFVNHDFDVVDEKEDPADE